MNPLILPISFSEDAKKEILSILSNSQIPEGYFLRVGTEGAGCAGVRFVIGFDEKKKNDRLLNSEDFPFLIANKDFMHLIGKKVDFLDNGDESGFVFSDDYGAG